MSDAVNEGLPQQFGRYTLVKSVGAGGMAELFLALANGPAGFRKVVAIKRPHRHLLHDSSFVARFHDEARLAAHLTHPNIVQTFGLGAVNGQPYIAMEYVHGATLSKILAHNHPIPVEAALTIGACLARGLSYAHGARDEQAQPLNLVHRDVHPRNVLLSFDGDVKLVDFGIARAADRTDVTATGVFKGTVRYSSPEQLRAEQVDLRSDIYSFGITLHETLTGRRLFKQKDELRLLRGEGRAQIPRPSAQRRDLPAELDGLVLKMLAPDPDERHQDCAAVLGDLRRLAEQLSVSLDRDCLVDLMRDRFSAEQRLAPLTTAEIELAERTSRIHITGPHSATEVTTLGPDHANGVHLVQTSQTVPSQHVARSVTSIETAALHERTYWQGPRIMVAIAVLLAASIGGAVGLLRYRAAEPQARISVAPMVVAPEPVAARARVRIEIESSPPGALVLIDGVYVGKTPVSVTRARDPDRTAKVLVLDSVHVPLRRRLALDKDQKLSLRLTQERTKRAHPTTGLASVSSRSHGRRTVVRARRDARPRTSTASATPRIPRRAGRSAAPSAPARTPRLGSKVDDLK